MSKEYKTEVIRVSKNLIEYIKHIIKRYKEEYGININFTESSNLLAKRAEEKSLFN